MRTFTRKGYGRIYIKNIKDVEKIKNIIKEMNEFEFYYLPNNIFAYIDSFPEVVYMGKFDELDLDLLTVICAKNGIDIFCFDNKQCEFSDYKKFSEI